MGGQRALLRHPARGVFLDVSPIILRTMTAFPTARFSVFNSLGLVVAGMLVAAGLVVAGCDSTGANGTGSTDTTAPAPPSEVSGTASEATVELTWEAVEADDLDGYNVYRSTSSFDDVSELTPQNDSPLSDASYTDDQLTNGTTYYYAVTAVDDSSNESEASSVISKTPGDAAPPSAPANFSGTAGDATVDLEWGAVEADDLDGYNVYRSTSSFSEVSGMSALNGSPLSDASYTDNDVSNGTTYYYRVTAIDDAGNESDPSSEVSKTPTGSDVSGRIAFTSRNFSSNPDPEPNRIFTINADGSDPQRVTRQELGNSFTSSDRMPAWSPDGSRIAFVSDRGDGDDTDIYTIKPDGSGLQQVTSDPGFEYGPAWSPDGSRLAFARQIDGSQYEIYTIDPDGSNPKRITDNPASAGAPAWSPDGSRIAFETSRDADDPEFPQSEIYTIKLDGSDPQRVTNSEVYDEEPDWSPDGSRLVFISKRDDDPNVYTIDPDGSNLSQVTESGIDLSPVWSPDGSRIAYAESPDNLDNNFEVLTIKPDGSDGTCVTCSEDIALGGPDGEAGLDWK